MFLLDMGKINGEKSRVQKVNSSANVKKKDNYTSLSFFNIFSGFGISFKKQNQELEINP